MLGTGGEGKPVAIVMYRLPNTDMLEIQLKAYIVNEFIHMNRSTKPREERYRRTSELWLPLRREDWGKNKEGNYFGNVPFL